MKTVHRSSMEFPQNATGVPPDIPLEFPQSFPGSGAPRMPCVEFPQNALGANVFSQITCPQSALGVSWSSPRMPLEFPADILKNSLRVLQRSLRSRAPSMPMEFPEIPTGFHWSSPRYTKEFCQNSPVEDPRIIPKPHPDLEKKR